MSSVPKLSYVDVICMLFGVILFGLAVWKGYFGLDVVFCGVVCFVPTILKFAKVVTFPAPMAFMIMAAAWFHCLGLIMGYYDTYANFDTVSHTLSSAVIAVLVFYVLVCVEYFSKGTINFAGRGLSIMTAVIALTFSVYWEVLEYGSDVFTGSKTQYSPYDTLTDLVCDSIGTFLGSAWAGAWMGRRSAKEVIDQFNFNDRIRSVLGDKE